MHKPPFWQRHLYPLLAGGGLLTGLLGGELGVLAWSLWVLALILRLERRQPFELRWRQPVADDTRRVDTPSALAVVLVLNPLVTLLTPLLALFLAAQLPTLQALWPNSSPWILQALLALLLSELAKYALHRAHHEWPPLWRLHALHHGSERLRWLNNFRVHPLNLLLVQLGAFVPLRLIGAPEELLLAVLAFTQPVLLLQHANVDLRSGVWNRVFSTNEAHRWHHSARPAEANRNYGAALLLWDQLFGTFRHPAPGRAPARIGLFGDGAGYPARASYWRQLLPTCTCQPTCCKAA